MEFTLPTCYCGEPAVMKTSWSKKNPGRRFVGCKNYGEPSECDFFDWVDPKFPPQANRVILGLLKKLNRMESLSNKDGGDNVKVVPEPAVGGKNWKLIWKWFIVVVFGAIVMKLFL